MAETLGSLIDKMTIKDLREYHLQESLRLKTNKFPAADTRRMIALVQRQKKRMLREIETFILAAAAGRVALRDEKLKMYNAAADMNRIPQLATVAEAISCLAQKNTELWHLEDQARRKDVTLAFIGSIKKKIDLANQQRNDLIDRIDALLEETLSKRRK
ncbi:MAG TPA: DUF4254 domain-containing protein [Candidatus Omnitrophota bacterium]|nr:DUF4254 domain-containing protein [Candidatus Omnitrophota bacterium]HRZ15169.1 DUF4254 domain-containing protein [Candidatus Omnitrophota bacterium]